MKKNIILILCVVWFVSDISAQTGWRKISSPVTDTLQAMEFGTAQTGYACGYNGRVIKTTNAGGSWSALNAPVADDLYDINAVSSTVLFACGNSGQIVKSTNGGSSWLIQSSGVTAGLRGISMLNASLGVAVGDSGVIVRTINGGTTWTLSNSGTQSLLNDVQMISSLTGYACGYTGTILKTTDGGLTWSQQAVPTAEDLNCVLFSDSLNGYACGNGGSVLQTVNGGVSWSQLAMQYTHDFFEILQPSANVLIVTSTNDWSLISYNSGLTWKIFYGGAKTIYGGAYTVSTSLSIYGIGSDGNIFKANFSDWTMDNNCQTPTSPINDIIFIDSITGYAATQNGVSRTVDGLHWNLVAIPGTYLTGIDFPTAAIGYVCDGSSAGIFKTLDSGATWTSISCPGAGGEDIWFLDANTGFYANGDLYKTINGGVSWVSVYSSPYDVIRVESTSQDTIFALTSQSWLYRSLDGGLTWKPLFGPTYAGYFASSIEFVSQNVGYFSVGQSGDQTIYKTVDGGENWFPVLYRYTGGTVADMHFVSLDTGYAVGRSGSNTPFAMKTTDGGATWAVMTFASNFGEVQCVDFPDARHGFLGSTMTTANIPICAYQCDDPTNTIPAGVFTEVSMLGPPPIWNWAESTGGDEVNCSVTDTGGNTVVCGYKYIGPMQAGSQQLSCPSGQLAYVIKVDSSGNVLWGVPLCNNGNRIYIHDVDVDLNGNIYLAGEAAGTFTLGSFSVSSPAVNAPCAFIAKLSGSGVPLWLHPIAVTTGGTGEAWGIKVTPSQELIITGACSGATLQFGSITVNSPYSFPYWVAKYTSAGVPVWAVTPGMVSYPMERQPMTIDSAGDVLIANTYAYIYWGGDTLISMNSSAGTNTDVLLSKISGQNGIELWYTTINGIEFNTPRDIATDANNNVYLAGTVQNSARFDTAWKSGVHTSDGFIARYNPQGGLMWARTEGSIDHQDITSIICGPDGTVYYAGHTQNTAHFNDTIITSGQYGSFFVAACNSAGTLIWIISAGPSSGPLGDPHWFASAWGIGLDADTNVYVTGNFKNTGSIGTSPVNFAFASKLHGRSAGMSTSLDTLVQRSALAVLYPNPASDQCVLSFNSPTGGDSDFSIYDDAGRVVRTIQLNTVAGTNSIPFSTEGLVSGVYTIVLAGPVVLTRILIVQE